MGWEVLLWSFITVGGLFALFTVPWWIPKLWARRHYLFYPLVLIPLRGQSKVGLLLQSMPSKWSFSEGYARNDALKMSISVYNWDRITVNEDQYHLPAYYPNRHEKIHIMWALARYERKKAKLYEDESLLKLAERIVEVYSHE